MGLKNQNDKWVWFALIVVAFLVTSNWYLKRVFGDTAGCPTTEIVEQDNE
jgi:hypothetical protein